MISKAVFCYEVHDPLIKLSFLKPSLQVDSQSSQIPCVFVGLEGGRKPVRVRKREGVKQRERDRKRVVGLVCASSLC